VDTQYEKCKNARHPFEKQWYLNLSFLNGKHYVSPVNVAGQGFKLQAQRAPAWRVRLVVNKIRVAIRTETSKLVKNKPVPTVVPATSENEDFNAAQVAEKLLKTAFARSDFSKTYRNWIWWGSVTGNSFLKMYWNPQAEDPYNYQPSEPELDSNGELKRDPLTGQPEMGDPKPLIGRIAIESINPFHIYVPDLVSYDLEDQPFLIHAMTRNPLWVKNTFGFMPTPDAKAASSIMDSAFLVAKGGDDVLDSVIVKEVWLKPNAHSDFPQGGLLTVINNRVVQVRKEWPLPYPEFPFYKFSSID